MSSSRPRSLRMPTVVTCAAVLAVFAAAAATSGRPATAAPAALRTAALPLAGLIVSVDPGHNPGNAAHAAQVNQIVRQGPIRKACDTTGAATNSGWPEYAFTGDLATRVARRLRAQGATVILTRANGTPAWGPCVTERAALGNAADVSISLHADGNNARTARGFHVIRPGFIKGGASRGVRTRSLALATLVRDALVAGTAMPVSTYIGRAGLDVRTDLGGLTLSTVPKVMLEAGNLRNATDARLLMSAPQRELLAAAITTALVNWHAAETA
ncbi:MAG: N-acetylmuramoyl-L-alanine amidase [Thermoleophilia bacterium]|nr:N-acetylmuramoyl-L-alanine amidase [Thermoleophilia bacterium]